MGRYTMSEKLNEKQELALHLVLEGLTDSQIAEQVGVSRQRVNIWRNQDIAFMQALEERKRVLREVHLGQLMHMIGKAMEVVREAMDTGNEQTRLKAAMYVLKLAGLQERGKTEDKDRGKEALLQALNEIADERGLG